MIPKIILIGKENVGKSTLFNKLVNKNVSITSNNPGVTKDYITSKGTIRNINFFITDTAGWAIENKENKYYYRNIIKQLSIIKKHNIIIFIIDSTKKITNQDIEIVKYLKKTLKIIIFIANKCDCYTYNSKEKYFNLGLGKVIFFSSEYNLGFNLLYHKIKTIISCSNI